MTLHDDDARIAGLWAGNRDSDLHNELEYGEYFIIDGRRSVVVRYSGLRHESNRIEINIFLDPAMMRLANGAPSLSAEAVNLFTLNVKVRGSTEDLSLIFDIGNNRRELDEESLMQHLRFSSPVDAANYRLGIIAAQTRLQSWDDEVGPVGSLRSFNPVDKFVFILAGNGVDSQCSAESDSLVPGFADGNVVMARSVVR